MEGLRQRVKKENEIADTGKDKTTVRPAVVGALSTLSGVYIVIGALVCYRLLSLHLQSLPDGLKVSDENIYPNRFIGERAENDLRKLVAIGTKVSGSYECEVLAVKTIREIVKSIASTTDPVHLLQENIQRPKGSFYLAFKPHGFQNIYDNIQNIAVRIGPKTPSDHSILVNCHFDTVPESPGASDNGLNCAVMLEVLRKLSRQSSPLKHNIIFLFNGAEETPLQAAHGFITQHIWRKEVRLVVNLDSGGAGGREVLFQANPDYPWIIKKYGQVVPHPSASLAAQELFESGLVPSDTDYRIFRDFGPVPGLDLAHADNGYIYHTQLDTMDYISHGVYQHTGDNVLALLRALANATELDNMAASKESGARHFYYDLFGKIMLVYSGQTGLLLNVVSVISAVAACYKVFSAFKDERISPIGKLSCAMGKTVFGVICGAVSTLLVSVLVDNLSPLSWYSKPQLIIPLYVCPFFGGVMYMWTGPEGGSYRRGVESAYGGLLFIATLLAALTFYGIRMSYFLMLMVLPIAVVTLLLPKISERNQLVCFGLSGLLGLCNLLRNVASVYNLLIPIAGRAGVTTNTELIIAGLTVVVCTVASSIIVPFLVGVRRHFDLMVAFAIATVLIICFITFTPLGFPYSANPTYPALQRFYIYQTPLKVHGRNGNVEMETSGLVLFPVDRNQLRYVKTHVPELQQSRPLNCSIGPLCGFPIYNGRYVKFANTAKWIDFPPPLIQYPTTIELKERNKLEGSNNTWRLTFKLKGPDHITLVFSPRPEVTVQDWSLGIEKVPSTVDGRNNYVVFFTDALLKDFIQFSVDLKVPFEPNSNILDMSVIGHYQHLKASYIPEFATFLKKFPSWAHVTPWITSVDVFNF